jgi:hypothetical protein
MLRNCKIHHSDLGIHHRANLGANLYRFLLFKSNTLTEYFDYFHRVFKMFKHCLILTKVRTKPTFLICEIVVKYR